MISLSRDDARRSDARRDLMCGVQSRLDSARRDPEWVEGSGMFPSRHQAYRLYELVRGLPLSLKVLKVLRGSKGSGFSMSWSQNRRT
jgi:hypothetical protein